MSHRELKIDRKSFTKTVIPRNVSFLKKTKHYKITTVR